MLQSSPRPATEPRPGTDGDRAMAVLQYGIAVIALVASLALALAGR